MSHEGQGMAGTLALIRQIQKKKALVDLVPSKALLAIQEYTDDIAEEVSSVAKQTVQVLTGKQSNISFNPKRTLVLFIVTLLSALVLFHLLGGKDKQSAEKVVVEISKLIFANKSGLLPVQGITSSDFKAKKSMKKSPKVSKKSKKSPKKSVKKSLKAKKSPKKH